MSPRWEYKTVELRERSMKERMVGSAFASSLRQRLEDTLNEHGREGWHLVGMVTGDTAGALRHAEGLIIAFERLVGPEGGQL